MIKNFEANTAEYYVRNIGVQITKLIKHYYDLNSYVAGGSVRDMIMGHSLGDIDIFVSLSNVSKNNSKLNYKHYMKSLMNGFEREVQNNIGLIKEAEPFRDVGNYGSKNGKLNFMVYEGRFKVVVDKIFNLTQWVRVQLIFVRDENIKSIVDLLKTFDIHICRCGIANDGTIVILPECQKDIDNKTITIDYRCIRNISKSLLRQEAFCIKYKHKKSAININLINLITKTYGI